MPGRKVLVLGNYRQTVTVVRSLARAGYPVVVGRAAGQRAPAELSRHASEVWIHPDPEQPRRFFEAVCDLATARTSIGYVFPLSEIEIQPLLLAPELSSRVVVVLPDRQALEICLDKSRTYAVARELGVPLPRTVAFADWAGLERGLGEVGFPCVVKRPDSIVVGGKKALICGDRAQLEAKRAAIEAERSTLVLQAWVPGRRHNCQFAARRGEIVAYYQQKVLRTDEADGSGLGVEGISVPPSPLLRAYCEAMVARLRYNGVGCIQFLVDDRTGAVALLEWNPRLDATCDLPYRSGYDFPLLALRLAEPGAGADLSPAELPTAYPAGRRIHWLDGDLGGLLRRRRRRELGRAGMAAGILRAGMAMLKRPYELGWAWRDPLPTAFLLWRAISRSLGPVVRARAAPRRQRVTGVAR